MSLSSSRLSAVVASMAALLLAPAAFAAPPVSPEFGMDDPVPVNGVGPAAIRWDVAWNGSELLAVWDLTDVNGLDVYGIRLTAMGTPIGAPFL
ncbi:MAG: hypothetical protein R3B70_48370, partial [Polyangiaceae bacterium]